MEKKRISTTWEGQKHDETCLCPGCHVEAVMAVVEAARTLDKRISVIHHAGRPHMVIFDAHPVAEVLALRARLASVEKHLVPCSRTEGSGGADPGGLY